MQATGKGKAKKETTPETKKRHTKDDSIRMINAMVSTKDKFLESDNTSARDVLDAGETKIYWEELVVVFISDRYAAALDKVLFKFEDKFEDAGLSPERTGWKATGPLLEEHYKKLRKQLNNAMGRFRKSGNGDGGPVDVETSVTQYSSKFLDFCDQDVVLEYMYTAFHHHGLIEFACSDMDPAASHDSTSGSSATSASTSTKKGEHDGLVAAMKEIFGSTKDTPDEDIVRKRKADAATAELRAQGAKHELMGAKHELIAKTSNQLDNVIGDLAALEGKDDTTSDAKRRRLSAQIRMLEAALDKLLEVPEA